MNKDTAKYIKSIKIAFPFFHKTEKRFFSDFVSTIRDYAEEHPNCTYEELQDNFGSPKDVVVNYYDTMDQNVYYMIFKRVHYIHYITITTIVLLFILFTIALSILIHEKYKYNQTIIDHIDTTITSTEQNTPVIKGDENKWKKVYA